MNVTDLEATKSRRVIDGERDGKLFLGDLVGRMEPEEFGYWARQWGKSLRSVREYRHTAKMCTPAMRKMLAGSRVLVSYTVLREGARKGPSGVPHDEDYRVLERLLGEARESGLGNINLIDYRNALDLGPSVEDLIDDSGQDLKDALDQVGHGPERQRLINAIEAKFREQAQARKAMSEVLAAERATRRERARENERLGLGMDPEAAMESACVKELVAIGDLAAAALKRYAHLQPSQFTDELNTRAITKAQITLETVIGWLNGTKQATPSGGRVPVQRRTHLAAV